MRPSRSALAPSAPPGARRRRRTQALTLAALGIGALAASPATAAADSLTYIKDGQVWVAATNGSDAHQVNAAAGEWRSPSLSDDGSVFVYSGGAVHIFPPGAPESAPVSIRTGLRLESLDVAPDRSAVAWMQLDRSGIGYDLVHNTGVLRLADGNAVGFLAAHWPTFFADHQLVFPGQGTKLYDPVAETSAYLFGTEEVWPLQVAPDRNGNITAMRTDGSIVGAGGRLVVADTSQGAPGSGAVCGENGTYIPMSEVTISPDGDLVAWDEPDGVHELRIGSLDGTCSGLTDLGLVIPGASSPDLGSSDDRRFPNPTPPAQTPSAAGAPSGSGAAPSGTATHKRRPVLVLDKSPGVSRSTLARRGVTVRFTAGRSGRVTAVARRPGAKPPLARGGSTLKAPGRGRVTLHLTARGRRLLPHRRSLLAVHVTLRGVTRKATITVRAR
jgi:hypothetical protein